MLPSSFGGRPASGFAFSACTHRDGRAPAIGTSPAASHATCGRHPRVWRHLARCAPRGSEAPPGSRGQACGHRPFAHRTRVMEDSLCQAKYDPTYGLINRHHWRLTRRSRPHASPIDLLPSGSKVFVRGGYGCIERSSSILWATIPFYKLGRGSAAGATEQHSPGRRAAMKTTFNN